MEARSNPSIALGRFSLARLVIVDGVGFGFIDEWILDNMVFITGCGFAFN